MEDLKNKITYKMNEKNEIIVSARSIYDYLEIKTLFRIWFSRMAEYGFEENEDYVKVFEKSDTAGGKQTIVDYMMKIDMAKEICMIQRSEKGKEVRKYFINVEKQFRKVEVAISDLLQLTNNNLENSQETTNDENIQTYSIEQFKTVSDDYVTNFRDTAKLIGIRENMLVNYLLINNICYRDNKDVIKPYAKYMEYFCLREYTTKHGHSGIQTLITPTGREVFKNLLIDENILNNQSNNLLEGRVK